MDSISKRSTGSLYKAFLTSFITFLIRVEFSSPIICCIVLFLFAFSSEHETIEKITNKRVINIVGLLIVTKLFSQRIFKLILQFYDHRCFKINNT